ncbi:polymer-forming cytoskeletal protein [Thermodesulfobacteriota bacterium]
MKKNKTATTFLGQDSEWDGTLTFDGSIRIDGQFKGHILSGGTLIIGEEGLVEAKIHVSYAIIKGEVYGDIIADQRVDIHAPGKVFGNIQAPSVVIDQGVIFEGTTRMYQAKEADGKESVLIDSDKYTGGPPPNLTAIHGIITDLNTGKPVKHAMVKCKGIRDQSANTNASGYYELINLKDGKWKLIIKAKGYKNGRVIVEISDGGNYKQNVELKPKNRR